MRYLLLELVVITVVANMLFIGKIKDPKITTVVLLNNGKIHNAVIVSTKKGSSSLDDIGAYVDMKDKEKSPSLPKIMPPEEIKKRFAKALSASPKAATSYRLYFKPKVMELTKESEETLLTAIKIIEKRRPCMVDVIGHTDTVGTSENNIKISLTRATYVKNLIDKIGVNVQSLAIKGFGEEDLLIQTKDNKSEAKNRNVEIFIK